MSAPKNEIPLGLITALLMGLATVSAVEATDAADGATTTCASATAPIAPSFKFALGETRAIQASGETGQIIGRAEYQTSENQYYLRYQCADGRAVETWWGESALA